MRARAPGRSPLPSSCTQLKSIDLGAGWHASLPWLGKNLPFSQISTSSADQRASRRAGQSPPSVAKFSPKRPAAGSPRSSPGEFDGQARRVRPARTIFSSRQRLITDVAELPGQAASDLDHLCRRTSAETLAIVVVHKQAGRRTRMRQLRDQAAGRDGLASGESARSCRSCV